MLPHCVSPFLLQFSTGVCSDAVHGLAVFEVVAKGKYQQAVKQTLGVASSMWVQNTGAQPLALVDVTPAQVEKKDKESMQGKTAQTGIAQVRPRCKEAGPSVLASKKTGGWRLHFMWKSCSG